MARRRHEIEGVISLEDKSSKTLKKNETGWKRLTSTIQKSTALQVAAIAGVALAIRSLVRGMGTAIDKAEEQEDSLKRLETASAKYGAAAEATYKKVVRFAEGLQKVSTVGDETAISIGAFLLQMGVAPKQIEEAVQGTADLAASLGMDLLAAARNVGKTVGGFAGELAELIPELKTMDAAALQAGEGISFLAEKFKGAAAAEAETFRGKLKQLNNAWSDMQQGAGEAITQNEGAVAAIDDLTKSVTKAGPGIAELTGGVIELAAGYVGLLKAGGDAVRGIALFAEGTIALDGAVKGGEVSMSAMRQTAVRLGISVQELAERIEQGKIRSAQLGREIAAMGDSMGDAAAEADRLAAAQKRLEKETEEAGTAMEELGKALGVVTAAELETQIIAIEEKLHAARLATKGFSQELIDLEAEGARQIEALELRMAGVADGAGDMGEEAANAALGFDTMGTAMEGAATHTERLETATRGSNVALGAARTVADQTAASYRQLSAVAQTLTLAQARSDLRDIQSNRGRIASRGGGTSDYSLSPFGTGGSVRLDGDGNLRPA